MRTQIVTILLISLIYNFSFSQENNVDIYRQAISDIHYKRYDNAEKILSNLISENNRDKKAYMLLGELNFKQAKYSEAANYFKEALKQKSKIATYHIAECYALLNNEILAVEYLRKYLTSNDKLLQSQIKINPAFQNIEKSKTWVNLWKEKHYTSYEEKLDEAKYLIVQEKYTEAFEIVDKLLYKNKRRHKAHEIRGDLSSLTGNLKSAAKSYIEASKLKKKNFQYANKAAMAYFAIRKYNKALDYCNIAINNNSTSTDILLLKTRIEINSDKYDEAQNTIKQFLEYYPDNSQALNLAGDIFHNKKEYINALEKYNLCIKNDSGNSVYYIKRADTYMEVSMYENAVKDFSMALDLNPKLAEIYYKKGIANIKDFNTEEACTDFKKALELGYFKASDYIVKYCK